MKYRLMNILRCSPLSEQISKFTIIGILAVLVDLTFYYIFLHIYPEWLFGLFSNEVMAKASSFLIGMNVTYYFNKSWTWKRTDRSAGRIMRFYFLYGFSLLLNVITNSSVLYVLYHWKGFSVMPYKYFIAFLSATFASAALNFAGQKFWIFGLEPEEARS